MLAPRKARRSAHPELQLADQQRDEKPTILDRLRRRPKADKAEEATENRHRNLRERFKLWIIGRPAPVASESYYIKIPFINYILGFIHRTRTADRLSEENCPRWRPPAVAKPLDFPSG
jgi:hypothetical protein